MAMRYTFTRAYESAGTLFPARLAAIDARMDPVLRAVGASNVQPSVAVESVIVAVTSLRDAWDAAIRQAGSAEVRATLERQKALALADAEPTAKAYLLPNRLPWFDAARAAADGLAPTETDLTAPLATLTLTTRTFDANLPALPYSPELCAALGLSSRQCGRFTSSQTAIGQALVNALASLPDGVRALDLGESETGLVAAGGGSGGMGMMWLALAAVAPDVVAQRARTTAGTSGSRDSRWKRGGVPESAVGTPGRGHATP